MTQQYTLPLAHTAIMRRLLDNGFEAYVVGGAVRDLVLGRVPKDYDVTTNARPDQIAVLFPGTDLVGAHFGVSLVKFDDAVVEVATYRVDGNYSDHRRPDMVGLTLDDREDLQRRDFTINALLMTVDGEVLDYVDGVDDLARGQVRAVGHPGKRFMEDPVRMLRMVRFAAQLGFEVNAVTAATASIFSRHLEHVAVERVAKELNGILTSGRAAYGMELMRHLRMTDVVLPELGADSMLLTEQTPPYHPEGDVWKHTLLMLDNLVPGAPLDVALAVLLHDTGKPGTLLYKENPHRATFKGHEEFSALYARQMLTRLHYPAATVENVVNLVEDHMRIGVLSEMREAKQLRFVRKGNFNQQLELHRLDAVGANGDLTSYKYGLQLLLHTPDEKLRPARLVTGNDLVKWGMTPGPLFKEVLTAVEDAQLEGTVTDRESAYRFWSVYMEDRHNKLGRRHKW